MVPLTMLSALSRIAPAIKFGKDNSSAIANINANSLLELSKVTEVEAITVVDTALTMHESTTDVMKFANTLYASWYISAASVLTDTGRVRTVDLLAKLNPSKSPSYAVANSILSVADKVVGRGINNLTASRENFGIDVPLENMPARLPRTTAELTTSLEAMYIEPTVSTEADVPNAKSEKDNNTEMYIGGARNANDLATVANLSIGQAVNLTVTDGKASKDVTVNIRLISVPTNARILSTILKWSDNDLRLKTRLSAWRAGELSFWRDVVLMRDVFTARQRLLMDDKSEMFKEMLGRQKNSMINSVLTAQPDVGNMSSVLVISQDNLRRMEEIDLNGRISNYTFRQTIMANTGLIMIIVVDPLSELVTVYKHTNALPTELSIRQMKAASKGGANDFAELIKLMNQNKMPSF